jgi:formate dehydrogenase subunit gamma
VIRPETCFPFYGTTIEVMQNAEIVHGVVAMLFIAAMLGDIYIGTIGMEGAFEAMGRGTIDLNWAREHHNLWLEEEEATRRADVAPATPVATQGPTWRLAGCYRCLLRHRGIPLMPADDMG